jgi:serine/threonine-protein kinase
VLGSGEGLLKLTDACTSDAFSAAGLSISDVQQDSIYYLAPERTVANTYGDAPATVGSDLYALGAILYRMLSGRVPFAGPSPVAVAMRHRHDEPLPPSRFNPQCPPDLEEIAMRLLAKEPAQRFASAQEVLAALTPQSSNPFPSLTPAPAPDAIASTDTENNTEVIAAQTQLETTLLDETPQEQMVAVSETETADAEPEVDSPPAETETATAETETQAAPVFATAPNLFPADLPITALAATPLTQLSASVVPVAVRAPATNAAMNKANITTKKTPQPQPVAVPSADPAIATTTVATAPAAPTAPDDEKQLRKKQRRREFWGAFLALLWVFIGVGMLGGIVYGSYQLWVNSAPKDVKVPSYIGLNEARAKQALSKSELTLTVRGEVFNPKQPAGTIVTGDPRPGRMVKAGRTVAVTISRGAEQTAMPDLSDLDLQRARQILSRAGMRIGNVTEIYHDRVARGYVAGQFPLAGEAFSRSEPINLVISRGPQLSDNTQASPDLLPPPPPPSAGTSTEDNPLTTSPDDSASQTTSKTPLVSRTVLLRVPVPAKDGATSRTVKIVIRDASGDHTIYNQSHAPGELIDEYVRVTRPQGSTATISIYIDGELQKQQKV